MSTTYQTPSSPETLDSGALEDFGTLPFADCLSEEEVQKVLDEENVGFGNTYNSIYSPALILWALLSQVISQGVARSCKAAVHRIIVFRLCHQLRAPSTDTSAYCRARAKLPLVVVQKLAWQVAADIEQHIPDSWRWRGHRVVSIDGTTVTLADTVENQAEWPQQSSQKKGLGFPIMRVVAMFDLASGAVVALAEGPYKGKETGETALLRELLDWIRPGDVVLADCYYCSYMMISLLKQRGAEVVMKLHHRRQCDFSEGTRLGNGDILTTWERPACPQWMEEATYETIPKELTIRLTECHVHVKGFRTRKYVTATTLTDVEQYPAESFGALYFQRWHAELDIRNLKTTMNMEHLVCKTPAMVRQELWAHILAYNLVRRKMAQSALAADLEGMSGLGGEWGDRTWAELGEQGELFAMFAKQYRGQSPVRYLSFATSLQVCSMLWLVSGLVGATTRRELGLIMRLLIASSRLEDRPHRVEPRVVKRRPKPHKLMRKPRAQLQAKILESSDSAA